MEEAVEHGGRDHGVVEDLAPLCDAAVGGQADAALEVTLGDDLEEGGGALGGKRQVAQFVELCRCRHSSTYADPATMPTIPGS
jgi:hypothetical protein